MTSAAEYYKRESDRLKKRNKALSAEVSALRMGMDAVNRAMSALDKRLTRLGAAGIHAAERQALDTLAASLDERIRQLDLRQQQFRDERHPIQEENRVLRALLKDAGLHLPSESPFAFQHPGDVPRKASDAE